MVRQAKLGRTNRMVRQRNLYGKENDMPIGRLAARRCTAERRTPFEGNLAEGDPKGAQAGARPTRRSPVLQRNEPNESEVSYVRLEISNRKVSRGQVCHDSGSQHGRAEVVLRRARRDGRLALFRKP